MTYQLKTTGIAANCVMCIAVDPDTGTIKDFASAAVTAAMTVDAGITFGEQTWDGITRKYFKLATGNYVAFGTNKPVFTINTTSPVTRSVVWIGEVAGGNARVFGNNASNYFCSNDLANGGANHPFAMIGSVSCGATNAEVSSGQKKIFGWSIDRNTASGSFIYTATDTDAAGTKTTKTLGSSTTYSLSYIGRRNDSTTQQADKIHAVLQFDTNISEADFDSLRDDWFSVLLKQEEGVAPTATITATTENTTFSGACTGYVATSSASIAATTANATFSGTATGSTGLPSLTTPPLKNNTGTLLASLSGWTVNVYNASTGALVLRKSGLSTDAAGVLTLADAALVAGTTYAYEPVHATYGRRLPTLAAA